MTLQEKYDKQKEINKELVDENEALKFAARMSEKTEKQLRKEIEEFKETNHELAELAIKRQKEIDELERQFRICEGNADTYYDQLTKATELLKQWLQTTYASGCDNVNLGIETEQFIKEIEK